MEFVNVLKVAIHMILLLVLANLMLFASFILGDGFALFVAEFLLTILAFFVARTISPYYSQQSTIANNAAILSALNMR